MFFRDLNTDNLIIFFITFLRQSQPLDTGRKLNIKKNVQRTSRTFYVIYLLISGESGVKAN